MANENDTQTPVNPNVMTPEDAVRELRALQDRMPLPEPAGPVSMRNRLSHVDADFIQAAVNATGASENVQNALGRTTEEIRQEIDVAARWSAVTDELRGLLRRMIEANVVRRQKIGLTALQTYKICQQLARDEVHSRLSTHIAEMRRLNKFGRRRRGAKAPEPEVPLLSKTQ
jgi:hypothetical protein